MRLKIKHKRVEWLIRLPHYPEVCLRPMYRGLVPDDEHYGDSRVDMPYSDCDSRVEYYLQGEGEDVEGAIFHIVPKSEMDACYRGELESILVMRMLHLHYHPAVPVREWIED